MNNKIIKFLHSKDIDWMPITVDVVEVDGKPQKLLKCNGKMNWFKNEEDGFNKIQKRKDEMKNNPDKYNVIAMDTSKVPQIDIDCPKYSDIFTKLMKTNPYTKSSTKEYGRHIFIINDFKHPMLKNRNQFKQEYGTDVELLSGQWAWLPMNFKIKNSKGEIGNGGNDLNDMIEYNKPKVCFANNKTKTKPLKLKPKKIVNKYDKIKTLINICPNEYFNEHSEWMKMCWSIHNATNGSKEGLKIFMDKSRQVEKYKDVPDETYKEKWYKSKTECENILTIKYIVNKLVYDDLYIIPDEDKTDYEYHNDILRTVELGSNYHIAGLFYKYYKNSKHNGKYVYCVNGKERNYYIYDENNILKLYCIVPECLSHLMTTLCIKEWSKTFEFINNYYMTNRYKDEQMYSNKLKELAKTNIKIIKTLGDTKFGANTIKKFNIYIQDDELINKIDNRADVFCCKTEIYDFKTKEWRKIQKQDYILTHVNYDLPENNKDIQNLINKSIKEILPKDNIRKYFLDMVSYSLFTNKFSKFNIMLGDGGNGKCILAELIQNTFGSYFGTKSPSFLTSASLQNGRADPELFDCKGKKIVMVSEPTSSIQGQEPKFNTAKVKSLTGGDEITARTLYGTSITFKPHFNLFVQCNGMPKLNEHTNAIMRRFAVVPFDTKFVKNPKAEHEKKIDYGLKDKFRDNDIYHSQFLKILFNNLKDNDLIGKELITPDEVENATIKTLEEGNDVANFITENYELNQDESQFILVKEIYDKFIFDTGNRCIPKSQVISYIKGKSRLGQKRCYRQKCVAGVRQMYIFGIVKLIDDYAFEDD